MSRMKSLASFLAVAMLVALVSFASAQTAAAPASAPAKSPTGVKMSAMTASSSKMTGTAKTKAATTTAGTKKEAAAKAAEMSKVDLNTGSKEDLMKVPGIGDATAEKIMAGRPWKMKSDLVKKGVMNSALYKKASPYMIAKAGK
jgi:competence protein ComEA